MEKIDYKKELSHLYRASGTRIDVVDVPTMNFLMVGGEGDPNTSVRFDQAVEVLYSLSYGLKFMVKKGELAVDYVVLPLEGLWWVDNPPFRLDKKDEWKWILMIMQPEQITEDLVDMAARALKEKKNPAILSEVRFQSFSEGRAAQTLHVGPYSEEGPTIQRLHRFIEEQGARIRGKHHEIYLSDPRRADSKNWKTILRQPMAEEPAPA